MNGTGIPTTRRPRVRLGGRSGNGGANRHTTKRSRNGSGFPRSLRDGGRPGRRWTKARRRPARAPANGSGMTTGGHPMASKRRRRRHRSRPARGEVRAVLAGGASADTTGVDADKCGHGLSAFEGASVPAVVAWLWEAATCADPTPARVYLERCGCWPGRHVRAPLPADSVRWLDASRGPERDEAAGWHGLPPGAVGAVVFAWRRPRSPWVQWGCHRFRIAGPLVAVTLVALDARRFPVREARSTVGSRAGAMFRAGDRGDGDAVTVWANDEGRALGSGWLETPWLEVLGGRRCRDCARGAATAHPVRDRRDGESGEPEPTEGRA